MCGLQIQWQMLYGEGVILSHPQNLLLDTFQRRCWEHSAKMFLRVEKGIPVSVPHGPINCSIDSKWMWAKPNTFSSQDISLSLFHYYQKSVEEWNEKIRRPLLPWQRVMSASYEKPACDLEPMTISPVFRQLVQIGFILFKLSVLRNTPQPTSGMSFNYGLQLNAPTELKYSTFKPYGFKGGENDKRNEYELYLYFSKKVSERMEIDNENYKIYHKDFASSYDKSKKTTTGWIDAIHHYYSKGFSDTSKTCFLKTKTLFDVLWQFVLFYN